VVRKCIIWLRFQLTRRGGNEREVAFRKYMPCVACHVGAATAGNTDGMPVMKQARGVVTVRDINQAA